MSTVVPPIPRLSSIAKPAFIPTHHEDQIPAVLTSQRSSSACCGCNHGGAGNLGPLAPDEVARQLPKPELEYETSSWYGPEKVHAILLQSAIKRAKASIGRTFFYGFLAGIWVGIGGVVGNCMSGGIAAATRTAYPLLPKIGTALTFPLALHWILLFGGELYTGNCMVLAIGLCNRRVTLLQTARNLFIVYIANFAGCLVVSYFLAYQTEYFAHEPYLSYVQSVATLKAGTYNFGVLFLRAIPANALVCMSVWLGLGARDGAGKFFHMWLPAVCFVLAGFEHSVANQFFITCGMLYGADTTVPWLLYNQAAVGLGNAVGGSLIMGVGGFAIVHWDNFFSPPQPDDLVRSSVEHQQSRGIVNTSETSTLNGDLAARQTPAGMAVPGTLSG